MITLKLTPNSIRMSGHANGPRINGEDVACNGISALTASLIIALQNLTHNRIIADTASGMTVIEWQKLSDKGKLLVDAWFLGLCAINEQYNCIQYI